MPEGKLQYIHIKTGHGSRHYYWFQPYHPAVNNGYIATILWLSTSLCIELAMYTTKSPLQFQENKHTRSNKYIWISKCHSGGEVITTILHVTLPIHKLVLLSLQHTKSKIKIPNRQWQHLWHLNVEKNTTSERLLPLQVYKPEWLFWSAQQSWAGGWSGNSDCQYCPYLQPSLGTTKFKKTNKKTPKTCQFSCHLENVYIAFQN